MQGPDTDKQSNVVSLFSTREKPTVDLPSEAEQQETQTAEKPSFEDVMVKNARNQERMAKERASANKSVLKSYRIKH